MDMASSRPCTCVQGTQNYLGLSSKEDENRPQSPSPPELRQGVFTFPLSRNTRAKLRSAHSCEHTSEKTNRFTGETRAADSKSTSDPASRLWAQP